MLKSLLRIHPRVQQALNDRVPVVALESTIISHGMPFPHNVKTALEVEEILSDKGVVPATIAIINGQPCIGLDRVDIEMLADVNTSVVKTSRRDMSYVISQGKHGATTVSTTMMLANMAGIDLFVTGGLGGVHRFGESTLDISADLQDLARTPVAVVCAGAKSILDIGRTLEYLETFGVPVTTISKESDIFPAFYARSSGFKSPHRVDSSLEAAKMIQAQFDTLRLTNGMVFAAPIPAKDALDSEWIEGIIRDAVKECSASGIAGKETTPFILKRVGEATQGKSLKANISLVKNNARVGADIALKLNKLRFGNQSRSYSSRAKSPLFVGVSAMDVITKLTEQPLSPSKVATSEVDYWSPYFCTSTPATTRQSAGGVARNMAEAFWRICNRIPSNSPLPATKSHEPILVSPVGDDSFCETLKSIHGKINLPTRFLSHAYSRTPLYNAMLDDKGRLICAGADMSSASDGQISAETVKFIKSEASNRSLIAIDGNNSVEIIQAAMTSDVPVLFEPTSVPKSLKLMQGEGAELLRTKKHTVRIVSPNREEIMAMAERLVREKIGATSSLRDVWSSGGLTRVDHTGAAEKVQFGKVPDFKNILEASHVMLATVPTILLKLGSSGVLLATTNGKDYSFRLYTPSPGVSVINVTGAGDSLVGAFIAGLQLALERSNSGYFSAGVARSLQNGASPVDDHVADEIMLHARRAAELSLASEDAVSPLLGEWQAK